MGNTVSVTDGEASSVAAHIMLAYANMLYASGELCDAEATASDPNRAILLPLVKECVALLRICEKLAGPMPVVS